MDDDFKYDTCEECKKNPARVGVTGIHGGEVTHKDYCNECWNKQKKSKKKTR